MIIILVFGIFGSIFYISTEVILRSLSVWLRDTEKIANKYKDSLLTTFSTYPEQIFSKIVKILLYTVVPVAYIAYIPMRLVYTFEFKYVCLIVGTGLLYLLVAISIFNKAMKRYESGNNIAMKM